jgi:biotin carboxyl carrier protein
MTNANDRPSSLPERVFSHGEGLLVPERMVVTPVVGVFRPVDVAEGAHVQAGQTIGVVDGPGTSIPVASPFTGHLAGMLAHPGERLREGQPIAWLRVQTVA